MFLVATGPSPRECTHSRFPRRNSRPSRWIHVQRVADASSHAHKQGVRRVARRAASRSAVGRVCPYCASDADHLSKYDLLNPESGKPIGSRDRPYFENSRYFLISFRSSALVSCRSSLTK
jgi:hypothetical protein